METGQLMNRIDNNIDSSDSTLPEETEVSNLLGKGGRVEPVESYVTRNFFCPQIDIDSHSKVAQPNYR
jgi:hypothetical protein